jgi:hypothetical protein
MRFRPITKKSLLIESIHPLYTSNSRNESNSRTANTVGTPTTAGMLAKVMKPATACREDNNKIDTINMRWQQQQ